MFENLREALTVDHGGFIDRQLQLTKIKSWKDYFNKKFLARDDGAIARELIINDDALSEIERKAFAELYNALVHIAQTKNLGTELNMRLLTGELSIIINRGEISLRFGVFSDMGEDSVLCLKYNKVSNLTCGFLSILSARWHHIFVEQMQAQILKDIKTIFGLIGEKTCLSETYEVEFNQAQLHTEKENNRKRINQMPTGCGL
ncbi:hypothetical protein CEB3_c21430 [Peptococcaceae bacterium CEB3]|nr:hypothetical protein CEB3_c21430 [Peptococcaceae bacterium CEB3]